MKKTVFSICLLFLSFFSTPLLCDAFNEWEEQVLCNEFDEDDECEEQDSCFTTAFTAGYVFKNGARFKEVYGHGMVNVITADGCYYPWHPWGIGAKLSYWRAKGTTNFLEQPSLLQEIPVTLYVRGIQNFDCGLQVYASLGGGFAWIKEKSYLGHVHMYKGIGEVELGLQYPLFHCANVTGAFRYLFPCQEFRGSKIAVGGFDLRAGIEIPF